MLGNFIEELNGRGDVGTVVMLQIKYKHLKNCKLKRDQHAIKEYYNYYYRKQMLKTFVVAKTDRGLVTANELKDLNEYHINSVLHHTEVVNELDCKIGDTFLVYTSNGLRFN